MKKPRNPNSQTQENPGTSPVDGPGDLTGETLFPEEASGKAKFVARDQARLSFDIAIVWPYIRAAMGSGNRHPLRFWLVNMLAGLWLGVGCAHVPLVERPPVDPVTAARKLTQAGKAALAFENLSRIVKDEPKNIAAVRAWIEAAYFSGRIDEVASRYRTLLGQDAENGLAHYGMALVEVALGPGHMEAALTHFAEAEKHMPGEADVPYRIGLVLAMNGDFAKAQAAIERALQLDPTRPAFRVALGNVLMHLGREQEAIDTMRSILFQSPAPEEMAKARAVAGKVFDPTRGLDPEASQDIRKTMEYLEQDSVQQALSAAQDLVARRPELAIAYTLKGLAHSRMEDNGEAVVAFERALELNPKSPLALVALGDVYTRTDNWQKARERYDQAVALDPFDLGAYQRLGELAETRQDPERAASIYGTLVLLDPTNIAFRQRYGMSLVKADRLQEALGAYQGILGLEADNVEALLRLGSLRIVLAQREPSARTVHLERAQAYLKEARILAPENQAVLELLSKLEE